MVKKISIILLLAGLAVSAGAHSFYGPDGTDVNPDKDKKKKEQQDPVKRAPESLLIDAKKEALTGNLKTAAEKFKNLTERYPRDPVAFYELARIESQMNQIDESVKHGQKAMDLEPENYWYAQFMAELCYSIGRYKEAIETYEKIVAMKPRAADNLYMLAALYMQTEKYPDAIRIYDMIEDDAGVSEEISVQKQKIYLHLNNVKAAEKEIRKLIAAFPAESRYYSILAEFYLSVKENEKALEIYKKIAEMDPDNAYIHMSLADYYRKAGDNDKAYEELKLGFATPNLDVDTKVNILLSFYTINEIYNELKDQAFTLAKILIETHPRDPKVYSIYGDFLLQDKQYPEARKAFEKVLELDSSRYVIWESILTIDLQLSDYNHLLEYGKRTIELFPEQPLPFLFCGVAYMQLKQYDEGLKVLKTGENLVVDNSELQSQFCMYQGDILHAQKKDEQAFQAYEKSLALRGDNAYVLNNYAYYLSVRGQELEKAERMSKKSIALQPDNPSFMDTYGWILFKMGNYTDAATWIQKSINAEESPSGEVLEHYGDVLFKLNEVDRAMEYWNKALGKEGASDLLPKKIAEKKYLP